MNTAAPTLAADPIGFGMDLLRRRGMLIAAIGLIGLVIAVVLALATPNRYIATAQLLIDPRDLRVLQNEVTPQPVNSDAMTAFLESQVRLITSDTIKRRVIERLNLAGDPDFGGGRAGLLGGNEAARRDPVQAALIAMDRQVLVRRGERTFVIDVSTITGDGRKSANVSNAMVEAYLEDQASFRAESSQRAASALSGRLAELRERVRIAEGKVEAYRAANNLVGASGKLITEEQLATASTQLTQSRARLAEAQARFDQIRAVRPSGVEAGSIPEALQSPTIAALRAQLGAALTREADARILYGAQHPALASAQEQARDSRRQIADEITRLQQGARAELERARAAESQLAREVERLKQVALGSSQAAVQLRELEREADASRQVFQAFLLRARETGELGNVDSTNARVITQAIPPLEKMGPNRKLYAVAGLAGGLLAGLLLAGLLDIVRWRRALVQGTETPTPSASARPAVAEHETPLNATTATRHVSQAMPSPVSPAPSASPSPAKAPRASGVLSRWRKAATSAVADPSPSGDDISQEISGEISFPAARGAAADGASAFHGGPLPTAAWDDATSPLARAVAALRDRLAIYEDAGQGRRIVVLALQPGAGASTVALNLTLATAREKATPLLIDLAGGPASLSEGYAADATLGASDVIAGRAGLVRAALQDDVTGAFFLPRPTGAERRHAPTLQTLADNLLAQTRRFDSVIIDAGALSDGALPFLLAELADDIVLVRAQGQSPEAARRMIERSLGPDAAKVRVVVVNKGA